MKKRTDIMQKVRESRERYEESLARVLSKIDERATDESLEENKRIAIICNGDEGVFDYAGYAEYFKARLTVIRWEVDSLGWFGGGSFAGLSKMYDTLIDELELLEKELCVYDSDGEMVNEFGLMSLGELKKEWSQYF